MLKYAHDSGSKFAGKVAENQMRISLGDGLLILVLDIMTKDDIMKGKVGSGPVREVRHNHTIRNTTVLVQNDQISNLVSLTGTDNLRNDMITTVDTLRVGEDKANFLRELGQTAARISRCSNKDLWIFKRTLSIFIVDASFRT